MDELEQKLQGEAYRLLIQITFSSLVAGFLFGAFTMLFLLKHDWLLAILTAAVTLFVSISIVVSYFQKITALAEGSDNDG